MEMLDALASSSVLGAVVLAQTFHVAAEPRPGVLLLAPAGLLGAIGISRLFPGVAAGAEWIAALVVLSAATLLTDGKYARSFSLAAGAALIPAVLASAAILEVAWSSVPVSLACASGALVAGATAGYALRVVRDRAVFREVALLGLLTALALMAGPTALIGWQRASIAAEGDESSFLAPSLWSLVPVSIAFLAGFAWRIWQINRTQEER